MPDRVAGLVELRFQPSPHNNVALLPVGKYEMHMRLELLEVPDSIAMGVHCPLGTAPVSQIRVPFGCAIKKQATERSVLATSSFFS